jgi:hypothetical protein
MSVTKVGVTHTGSQQSAFRQSTHGRGFDKSLTQAKPGQEVSLNVVQKIQDGRFVASIRDSRYVVTSSVPLTEGTVVKASVSSVGEIIELKYLGHGQFQQVEIHTNDTNDNGIATANEPGSAALIQSQKKYHTFLPVTEQHLVATISDGVQFPEVMALGALYLSRLSEPMQPDALQALYAKQVWVKDQLSDVDVSNAADLSALIVAVQQGSQADLETLAKILDDKLESSSKMSAHASDNAAASVELATTEDSLTGIAKNIPQSSSSTLLDDKFDGSLKELASHLLNKQDMGRMAYHYGSLPMIVANQLVELDVVLFRERGPTTREQGLRKLVMTFKTETLGKVEVLAQSVDAHLTVSIAVQSESSIATLTTHAQEIRDLLFRLGWNVDGVSVHLNNTPARAAESIVKHVLGSGSLNKVL